MRRGAASDESDVRSLAGAEGGATGEVGIRCVPVVVVGSRRADGGNGTVAPFCVVAGGRISGCVSLPVIVYSIVWLKRRREIEESGESQSSARVVRRGRVDDTTRAAAVRSKVTKPERSPAKR